MAGAGRLSWATSQRTGGVSELAVLSPIRKGQLPGERRSYEERLRATIANLAKRHQQGIPNELDRLSTIHFGRLIIIRPEQYLLYSNLSDIPYEDDVSGHASRPAARGEVPKPIDDNHSAMRITTVCVAFGDGGNHPFDAPFAAHPVADSLSALEAMGVACCAAAGDGYYPSGSIQGMAYPAVLRGTLSVGAVYGADVGPFPHPSGAETYETRADRVAAFSQRLHSKVGRGCATSVFAPGGPTFSSGIMSDTGTSLQHGICPGNFESHHPNVANLTA